MLFYKGGGVPIPLHVRESIHSYLTENSSPASNRVIRDKTTLAIRPKQYVCARYLNENKHELYKTSPFTNVVSKSTFFKYTNAIGIFKNPQRYFAK
jgi:hypothetical protein